MENFIFCAVKYTSFGQNLYEQFIHNHLSGILSAWDPVKKKTNLKTFKTCSKTIKYKIKEKVS